MDVKVIWVRHDLVYLAPLDSLAVEPGTLLSFHYRGRKVAEGEVTGVDEGDLILARVTSGSLEPAKQWGGIQIQVEPAGMRAPSVLRVGFPSVSRRCLFFECGLVTVRLPQDGRYWVESITGRTHRFVRERGVEASTPWPDTLLLRLFDDPADEEIALERGELDVAIFWPGEASAQIREFARGRGRSIGGAVCGTLILLAKDVAESTASNLIEGATRRCLSVMNRELFHGDLTECGATRAGDSPRDRPESPPPTTGRFEVDHRLPGWKVLEEFLNQEQAPRSPVDERQALRVFYREGPPPDPRAGNPIRCLFEVRCPVLSAPRLRAYVEALGPEALMDLIECGPLGGKP